MTHSEIDGLLGDPLSSELLDYAIANESRFTSTSVGSDPSVNPRIRSSVHLTDLAPFVQAICDRVVPRVPQFTRQLGITPYPVRELELELVAHQNGGFYSRHIDLFTGNEARSRLGADRFLSIVCYLHSRPKRFTGGELRLFPEMKPLHETQRWVDVVPEHGKSVAFSSWIPHEVRPVQCSSPKFADARFALNCWVLRDPAAKSLDTAGDNAP